MRELLKENIGTWEMGIRFLLGAALLSAAMFDVDAAVWIALFAIYPVITAIMAWDPLYAVFSQIFAKAKAAAPHKHTALPAN